MVDITIELGGRSFVIPPFTLRRVKTFVPAFAKLISVTKSGEMTETSIDDAVDALLIGIQACEPSTSASVIRMTL